MCATACFVQLRCADNHYRIVVARRLSVDQSLRARGFSTTYHTNGMKFMHFFRDRHQDRHRTEWLTSEVRIQPSRDDAESTRGEVARDGNHLGVKKLRLVDADNSGIRIQVVEDLGRFF